MSTYQGVTDFSSKLDSRDVYLCIDGDRIVVEFSSHSVGKRMNRGVFESSVTHMVERAYRRISRLQEDERFILRSRELGISVVMSKYNEGSEVVISVISVIDSLNPTNPHGTTTITY